MADDPDLQLCQFVLGGQAMDGQTFCHFNWCNQRHQLHCGCPACLSVDGLTLIYHVEDWKQDAEMKYTWRKRVVALSTAKLASRLIVEGYPGSPQDSGE